MFKLYELHAIFYIVINFTIAYNSSALYSGIDSTAARSAASAAL